MPEELQTLIDDNGDADFARIDLAAAVPAPNKITQDAKPYIGRHPPLAAVELASWKLPKIAKPRREPPAKLSGWGLFKGDGATQQPVDGVIPYDINTPLFSDYALKYRFVKLPEGKSAAYSPDGMFKLPVGTVIAKTFAMPLDLRQPQAGQRLLETRILEHSPDGWLGWAYVWNDEQTEADVSPRRRFDRRRMAAHRRQAAHEQLSRAQREPVQRLSRVKRRRAADRTLARQLNRDFGYLHGVENQLAYWTRTKSLAGTPADVEERAPRVAVWDDPKASLDARARAWLEINCAHCHQPGGAAQNSGLDLRASQREPVKIGIRKPPVAAGLGSGGLHSRHSSRQARPIDSHVPPALHASRRDDARARQANGSRRRGGVGAAVDYDDGRRARRNNVETTMRGR